MAGRKRSTIAKAAGSSWNTLDIATAYAQWVAWRDAIGDIKRPKQFRERMNELVAVMVEYPQPLQLPKVVRDALAKLRAEIES